MRMLSSSGPSSGKCLFLGRQLPCIADSSCYLCGWQAVVFLHLGTAMVEVSQWLMCMPWSDMAWDRKVLCGMCCAGHSGCVPRERNCQHWGNADFLNPFSTFSPSSTHICSFTSLGVMPRNSPSFAIRQPNKFPPVSVLENLVLVPSLSSASTPIPTSVIISSIFLFLHPGVSFLFSSVA